MTMRCGATAALVLGALAAARADTPVKFDGGRAYEHVRQFVGIGPRPAGSQGLEATRRYIAKQMSAIGVTTTEQAFTAETPLGAIRMVNVIVTIPGARAERIAIGGHYDTKLYREFRFVGANDGGSAPRSDRAGARAQGAQQSFTVELLSSTARAMLPDWGRDHTYGSQHASGREESGTLAALGVHQSTRRRPGSRIRREQASTTWLTDLIWLSARRLKQDTAFLNDTELIEDDHVPFLDAGVPAVDIIDLHYAPWHTAGDTLDKVSARSLQIVGDVLLDALPAIEGRLSKKAPEPPDDDAASPPGRPSPTR
jgi:hypothetical protein